MMNQTKLIELPIITHEQRKRIAPIVGEEFILPSKSSNTPMGFIADLQQFQDMLNSDERFQELLNSPGQHEMVFAGVVALLNSIGVQLVTIKEQVEHRLNRRVCESDPGSRETSS